MAVSRTFRRKVYGLHNATQSLAPAPIVANRAPSVADQAELSALWVDTTTNAYYVLTSFSAGDSVWTPQSTGSASQASLTVTGGAGTVLTVNANGNTLLGGNLAVTGNSVMTGNLIVNGTATLNGSFDLTDSGVVSFTSTSNTNPAILLHANGGVSETIKLHSDQGTALDSIQFLSDVGGIKLTATGSTSNQAIDLNAVAGGIQFDAALTSTWNVVGAAQDIVLNASGGSVLIDATESIAGAIAINASGALGTVTIVGAGGVNITGTNDAVAIASGTGTMGVSVDAANTTVSLATGAGVKLTTLGSTNTTSATTVQSGSGALAITATGGTLTANSGVGAFGLSTDASATTISIATGAATKLVTIGNVTSATAVTVNTGTGGFAVNTTGAGDVVVTSADTVLIDAAGVLELNSSAGIIGIGNDAVAQNINVGTGAAARVITVGNVTGATSVTLNSGSGGVAINTTVTGDVVVTSADTVLIDAAGVLELNSSAGVISIGNDAVSQNIGIGTAGVRTVTVGNNTGATSVSIQAGTAGLDIVATNGALTIRSGTATLAIANDATAQTVSLATGAAAKLITLGNTTAGTTLALSTPTAINVVAANGLSVTTAGRGVSLPGGVLVLAGAGDPNGVVAAPIGSMWLRTDPAGAASRAYCNTNAGTIWTNFSMAA